jgi:lysophospholipase L1-like esterase
MITFIYGDSITQGLWDSQGGWADRVKASVQAHVAQNDLKGYHKVFNLGVDGNTTKLILERFGHETKARLWPGEEYAFIFATGTNDALHRMERPSKIIYQSEPKKYAAELKQLIEKAKAYTSNIFFIELIPVDEARTNPLEGSSSGKSYYNERIQLFNETLHQVCSEHELACIRTYESFKEKGEETLLMDGVHPNTDGHELIYRRVMPRVKQLLKF